MADSERVSDLDDPLAELESRVEDGRAEVFVDDDVPWGEQARIDTGGDITVTPEEHDMKKALLEYDEPVREMVDVDEEEWPDVLDRHDIEDGERREQLRVFARSARE